VTGRENNLFWHKNRIRDFLAVSPVIADFMGVLK
jgi:hypothetical protein